MISVEEIIDYYNENYTECGSTNKGQFVPSNLDHIDSALEMSIEQGFIDKSGYFLDAGCGDGRIIALASGKYNLDSIGIEYEEKLTEKAEHSLSWFKENKTLDNFSTKIINGDFTKDSTYAESEIDFKEIKTFYNYINNQDQIAKKIADKSPKGTTFLLYRYNPNPVSFSKLQLVKAFMLYDPCPDIKGWDSILGKIPKVAQFHIYKKI